jgi:DNA-binding transcriptional regulator YiaG
LVKALRHHLSLSQAELADKLGMRQQTISDWETNVYTPRRSTSKYLSLIAEQAGFTYGEAQ